MAVTSLFRTSIFIRRFAAKEKRQRAAKGTLFDNRADTLYARERYPLLERKNKTLILRLGEANARRRQYFKYCRDHAERLANVEQKKEIITMREVVGEVVEISPIQINTGHSTTIEPTLPSGLADTEATALAAAEAELEPFEEYVIAQPAMSIASFATSIVNPSDGELAFPPIPVDAEPGSVLLCYLCHEYFHMKLGDIDSQWKYV